MGEGEKGRRRERRDGGGREGEGEGEKGRGRERRGGGVVYGQHGLTSSWNNLG